MLGCYSKKKAKFQNRDLGIGKMNIEEIDNPCSFLTLA